MCVCVWGGGGGVGAWGGGVRGGGRGEGGQCIYDAINIHVLNSASA